MSSEASEPTVDRVAELLYRQIGLRAEPTLRGRLRRCIRDDSADRYADGETYLASLRQVDGLQSLVDRVTVQETAFFRHPEHFETVLRDVLPTLPRPVTIWSAGCANGQEAFSLAMLLDEQGVDGVVIASDISTNALARTAAGRYSARELGGLSPERMARHLTRTPDGWQVNQSIRDRVRVVRHNLLDGVPEQARSSRLVFCRNVLIYFGPEHMRRFLDGVADALPASTLFLGSAETIWPMNDRFETVPADGTFFYRPRTDPSPQVFAPVPPVGREAESPAPPAPPAPRRTAPPTQAPSPRSGPPAVSTLAGDDRVAVDELSGAGERAMAAGDYRSAVVAFRKCAYLSPHDPATHLHLALALDAAGDPQAAGRAYAAARRALHDGGAEHLDVRTGGYTTEEWKRLLDAKLEAVPQ
jgi:chemotaxis protein methyltransferase CheR